ncbi:hypothetical protein vseg_013987 [Gypsophila vaccaria]
MAQNTLQNIHVKLLAFDVAALTHKTIPTTPDPTTFFYRKGLRITHLEVAGVVVTRDHIPDKFIRFSVDDGTGCVQCIMWLNQTRPAHFPRQCTSTVRCNAQMTSLFLSRVELGAFVRVRGRLGGFRGLVQVTVDDVVAEVDPNSDVLHWLDCVNLGRKCYDPLACHK